MAGYERPSEWSPRDVNYTSTPHHGLSLFFTLFNLFAVSFFLRIMVTILFFFGGREILANRRLYPSIPFIILFYLSPFYLFYYFCNPSPESSPSHSLFYHTRLL
jgi:hypothetical protein